MDEIKVNGKAIYTTKGAGQIRYWRQNWRGLAWGR